MFPAHINPAVTLALWATKRFPAGDVIPYIAAQLIGAALGSLSIVAVLGTRAAAIGGLSATAQFEGVTYVQAIICEAIATFFLECKLLHTIDIGLHTEFIGEIMDFRADEIVLGKDGLIDVEKLKPVIFAPDSTGYYGIGKYLGKAFSIGKR